MGTFWKLYVHSGETLWDDAFNLHYLNVRNKTLYGKGMPAFFGSFPGQRACCFTLDLSSIA